MTNHHPLNDPGALAAGAMLKRMAERGVELVFANSGTDFAPIVEALARDTKGQLPRFVTVPHENLAVAMANGYYRMTGKPAVVMCHVTVGTANALCNLMNAARDNVPIVLMAGRTPSSETGHPASRNSFIHWGTEAFDQGGIVREYVKWDYELRQGQPVADVIDRALDIAMTEPRGPVYLTLPREILCDPAIPKRRHDLHSLGATAPQPSLEASGHAAAILAQAKFPLIIAGASGRTQKGFDLLTRLAQEFAIPVSQPHARELAIASDHPMAVGGNPHALLPDADAILVLDNAVPWLPGTAGPNADAKVIHLSSDPLAMRYPFREYEADLLITGENVASLEALLGALRATAQIPPARLDERRARVAGIREANAERRAEVIGRVAKAEFADGSWIAHCLGQQMAPDALVVNELGFNDLGFLAPKTWGSYLAPSLAGGLGFALGGALGAKLANPDREVIVCCGEGSYMFGNPVPYHFMQLAEKLPTLTIISNNSAWHAVRVATLSVFPDGAAAKSNDMPVTSLTPSPDYEKIVGSIGGYGEKVERPSDLPDALARGLAAVRAGQPAVLNVLTRGR